MQSSASIEEAMPRGGRGGGEQGCTEQGHEPATPHPGQGEEAPCHSPPPFPTSEMKKELGHEQQASLPHDCTEQDHSPSTGNQGRDSATPPFPSTDEASENHHQQQQPGADLPEGAIVEILSRVPYRSLCRFKCVSKPWLALCSDPNVRKRSPQTLSGFFFIDRGRFSFRNLSGRGPPLVDPSLHFLRGSYDCFSVEQCCSSLLLCKCWESRHDEEDEYDYVVCNPMTGQWTVLPPVVWVDEEDGDIVYFEPIMDIFLGFDTAVPSRFVVFVPLTNCFCEFTEMAIYLSETGRWTKVQSEWYYKTILVGNSECVFLNGTMHLATHYASVVTVDAEGKVWREIEMPEDMPNTSHLASIGQSQGRLYAWQIDNDHDCQLYVWVLEDYGGGKWTLKYTINVSELFGRQRGKDEMSYKVFAIHPDCDLIFLTDEEEMAVSYDMENHKVNATCTFSQEFQDVLPYIPCFAEWSSDGH